MNKDLYGKEYQIPPHLLNMIAKGLAKYSNQSTENVKRAQDLISTGNATYQQLKRIKRFITEWNLILVVYFILMGMIGAQMLYIYRIKSELKLFQDNENIPSTSNNGK